MDPTTGTFLSPDPLAQSATQPDISSYLYVGDQPTVLGDPTGMSAVTDQIGGRYGESGSSYGWLYRANNDASPWLEGLEFVFDLPGLDILEGISAIISVAEDWSEADTYQQNSNEYLNNDDSVNGYVDYAESSPLGLGAL